MYTHAHPPTPTQKGKFDVPLLKGSLWRHCNQEDGSGGAGGKTWLCPRTIDCSTSAFWHSMMEVSGIFSRNSYGHRRSGCFLAIEAII